MARVNLRAAFMSGLSSPVAAQEVFADRADETAAFHRALGNLRQTLDDATISPVVDRVQGRRNVLSFYGVGGIGKTTLSHELERRFLADAGTSGRNDVAAVRIDLGERGATDVESLVLRLRAGLGRLGPRWTAFDLALSCYWARAHPGEELQSFLDASPTVRRAADNVGLGQQIADNVELLTSADLGGLPGLAQRAGLGIYRAVRDKLREGRLLADCDLFAELVEADADHETLSFFPYLLAWDLERLPRRGGRRPSVCVFLDTFEALGRRPDTAEERLVQRCIYLMPNVLFVVTGRNRIDWSEGAGGGELDVVGPERWPNLHFANGGDEPRQHLIGYLSDADADTYLRAALTRDGDPAIPTDIRQRIITGGQGLPLYLDLSVSHYVELLARDGAPDPDDFGGSFRAVASRSIRDLPGDERNLVRTAALVDRFDADLLRAGRPELSDGLIGRFLRRPFLTRDDTFAMPYALHLALRSALRDADETLPDGWSDRDRAAVAARLLRGLGTRVGGTTHWSAVAPVLEAGLALAHDHDVFDDWLVEATQRLVDAGQWTTLSRWIDTDGGASPLRAVRAAISGVLLRRTGAPERAIAVLEAAEPHAAPGSRAHDLVQLHLAHALRNTGDYTRAAATYRDLAGGSFDEIARYWLCDHDYLTGRFAAALSALRDQETGDVADEGERLRLLGHISRVNARFDEAIETYNSAIDLARTEGLAAAEAKALTNLAQTQCWNADIDAVATTAETARELLDLVPNPVERVKLRSAEAVAAALGHDHQSTAVAATDTRHLADEIGYRGGHNLADVADILSDVLTDDHEHALRTLDALHQRTQTSGGNAYWVPIASTWLTRAAGVPADDLPRTDPPEWLDGPVATLGRWARVVTG